MSPERSVTYVSGTDKLKLERETGFEPATSTLARSHSTTELLPLDLKIIQHLSSAPSNQAGWGLPEYCCLDQFQFDLFRRPVKLRDPETANLSSPRGLGLRRSTGSGFPSSLKHRTKR